MNDNEKVGKAIAGRADDEMPPFIRERIEWFELRMLLTDASPADVLILFLDGGEPFARLVAIDLGHEPGWWNRHEPGGMVLLTALASRPWIAGILDHVSPESAVDLRAVAGVAVVILGREAVLVLDRPRQPS